jgi:hypothetical protein
MRKIFTTVAFAALATGAVEAQGTKTLVRR